MGTVVPFGKRRAPNRAAGTPSWPREVLTLAVRAGSVVVEAADVEIGLTADQARRLARNLIACARVLEVRP